MALRTTPPAPRTLRSLVDGFDVVFGLLPWLAGYGTFVIWARVIVGAIRGEEVSHSWSTDAITALFIAAGSLASAARVRAGVALHDSVAELREAAQEASEEAERRDARAAARDAQLYRVTVKMAWVAGLTLAAAILTLIVTLVGR